MSTTNRRNAVNTLKILRSGDVSLIALSGGLSRIKILIRLTFGSVMKWAEWSRGREVINWKKKDLKI